MWGLLFKKLCMRETPFEKLTCILMQVSWWLTFVKISSVGKGEIRNHYLDHVGPFFPNRSCRNSIFGSHLYFNAVLLC